MGFLMGGLWLRKSDLCEMVWGARGLLLLLLRCALVTGEGVATLNGEPDKLENVDDGVNTPPLIPHHTN